MVFDGRVLIGSMEYVRLPDWRIGRLRAKVDTGARTSALHVEELEELPGDRVRFEVAMHRSDRCRSVQVETPVVRRSAVRSSSGQLEERIFVRTRILLGAVEREIEVSLTSRHSMRFRMLLGRSALKGTFVVDPGRRYIETHEERREVRARRMERRP